MEYLLIQTVRVGRSARHILRGRILDVPEGSKPQTVADALTEAGLAPSEAGIEWANHSVMRKAPDNLEDPPADPPVWSWSKIEKPAERQLNTRIAPRLYALCEAAAQAQGLSLAAWVRQTLSEAVKG